MGDRGLSTRSAIHRLANPPTAPIAQDHDATTPAVLPMIVHVMMVDRVRRLARVHREPTAPIASLGPLRNHRRRQAQRTLYRVAASRSEALRAPRVSLILLVSNTPQSAQQQMVRHRCPIPQQCHT